MLVGNSGSDSYFWIDCMPWRCFPTCPFDFSIDLGRFFITVTDARPGNVVMKPSLMGAQSVHGIWMKISSWRKARRSGKDSCTSMLLYCGSFMALKGLVLSK